MRLTLSPACRTWLLVSLVPVALRAQGPSPYRPSADLDATLSRLAATYSRLATAEPVTTSAGGKPIRALRIGAGADVATRPALLVVANAYGPQLVGSEAAIATAERLLNGYGKDSSITRILDHATIWFVPRLNPDAADGAFGAVRSERVGNGPSGPAYHDAVSDGIVPTDLNGDGLITMMRIADANGEWLDDTLAPQRMRRAISTAGETGKYRLVTEGKSNGLDGLWDANASGGTDVNRNFTHNYSAHAPSAGVHSFSTPEARGLVEFLVAHDMIGTVYVMGPEDNLATAWHTAPPMGIADPSGKRSPEGTSAGGQLNSILAADAPTFENVASRFHASTGLSGNPEAAGHGDLLSFLYYDFGRWAFGSRVWWVPEKNPSTWFRAHDIDAFVPWRAVTNSGVEGTVEVGGWKPGALWNPPAGPVLDTVIAQQQRTIVLLAGMLPRIALRNPKVESVGDGVWRVGVDIANEGQLPTTSQIGARLRNPRGVRIDFTGKAIVIASGKAIQVLQPIAGGGRSVHLEWTITGTRGTEVTIKAGSPATGTVSTTVALK